MMRLRLKLLIATLISLALFSFAPAGSAQQFDISRGIVGNLSPQCQERGDCTWCDFVDLMLVLQKVILSLFSGLALIMLIWGGQGIITAAGNQEKVAHGKKLITSTLLGVVIILAGYILVHILIIIIVGTPPGQRPLLFSRDWYTAQCLELDPTKESFCRGKATGTPCGGSGSGLVCSNGQCNLWSCSHMNTWDPSSGTTFTCRSTCLETENEAEAYCPSPGSTPQKCCYQ